MATMSDPDNTSTVIIVPVLRLAFLPLARQLLWGWVIGAHTVELTFVAPSVDTITVENPQ